MTKEPLRTFTVECSALAALETFDPNAFQGDPQVPQNICNFILSLAVIHNDCRDLIYAHILLQASKPEGQYKKSKLWGTYYGIEWHIFRLTVSLLHELFNLIREQAEVLREPFLQDVVRKLRSNTRDAWYTLADVAVDKGAPKDDFGRILLQIRNKVAFHYDPKAIFKGYSEHFFGATKEDDCAYISRGSNMRESRFYFADVVSLGYLRSTMSKSKADDLQLDVLGLLEPVNFALMGVVDGFIQSRGFGYKPAE